MLDLQKVVRLNVGGDTFLAFTIEELFEHYDINPISLEALKEHQEIDDELEFVEFLKAKVINYQENMTNNLYGCGGFDRSIRYYYLPDFDQPILQEIINFVEPDGKTVILYEAKALTIDKIEYARKVVAELESANLSEEEEKAEFEKAMVDYEMTIESHGAGTKITGKLTMPSNWNASDRKLN